MGDEGADGLSGEVVGLQEAAYDRRRGLALDGEAQEHRGVGRDVRNRGLQRRRDPGVSLLPRLFNRLLVVLGIGLSSPAFSLLVEALRFRGP
jgi:hypothetical protein